MKADLEDLVRRARDGRLPLPEDRRLIRRRAGLSLAQVAEALGVSIAAVSRYETGDRTPRGDVRLSYAELLARLLGETIR